MGSRRDSELRWRDAATLAAWLAGALILAEGAGLDDARTIGAATVVLAPLIALTVGRAYHRIVAFLALGSFAWLPIAILTASSGFWATLRAAEAVRIYRCGCGDLPLLGRIIAVAMWGLPAYLVSWWAVGRRPFGPLALTVVRAFAIGTCVVVAALAAWSGIRHTMAPTVAAYLRAQPVIGHASGTQRDGACRWDFGSVALEGTCREDSWRVEQLHESGGRPSGLLPSMRGSGSPAGWVLREVAPPFGRVVSRGDDMLFVLGPPQEARSAGFPPLVGAVAPPLSVSLVPGIGASLAGVFVALGLRASRRARAARAGAEGEHRGDGDVILADASRVIAPGAASFERGAVVMLGAIPGGFESYRGSTVVLDVAVVEGRRHDVVARAHVEALACYMLGAAVAAHGGGWAVGWYLALWA